MALEGLVAQDTVNKKFGVYSFVVKSSSVEELWQSSCLNRSLLFHFSSLVILWNLGILVLMHLFCVMQRHILF